MRDPLRGGACNGSDSRRRKIFLAWNMEYKLPRCDRSLAPHYLLVQIYEITHRIYHSLYRDLNIQLSVIAKHLSAPGILHPPFNFHVSVKYNSRAPSLCLAVRDCLIRKSRDTIICAHIFQSPSEWLIVNASRHYIMPLGRRHIEAKSRLLNRVFEIARNSRAMLANIDW